ncbi:MAG TPA: substrate-binding domain-containing protein [Verrucomicrobiae bacterium]|nr:substrate-binding domain-containing protein [Verrucomicrobiae bacterium]
MKKTVIALLAILITGGWLGSSFAQDKLTIAVIPKSTGGEFWETVHKGAENAAQELGVTMKWEGTVTETEIAEQNKIIENMVNMGVQGIALAPLNKIATRREVEDAVAAGIPVVVFDSAVDGTAQSSFVATDNKHGGVLGAQELARLIGHKKAARVMCMRFVQGTGSTEARAAGFIEAAKAAGYDVVADPYPDTGTIEGCKTAAANTLEKFVKDGRLNLDGLFACNLYSTIGLASALEDLQKSGVKVDAKFVGFDTSKRLVEDVQNGTIDALVAQNPAKMGYLVVQTLVKVIRKEKVPAVIDTGTELVTKEKLATDPEVRKLCGLE